MSRFLAAVFCGAIVMVFVLPDLAAAPARTFVRAEGSVIAPRVSVLFAGDMMFDRWIRRAAELEGGDYIFSCLDELLQGADVVVGNLEGPITANASVSAASAPGDTNNYTFTFPLSTAELLATHNVRVVNLGNNHIRNFGTNGVLSTIRTLDLADVSYFGEPHSENMVEIEHDGIKLAFINYNEFGGTASSTLAHILEARATGAIPIVYTHWGDEYKAVHAPRTEKLAHQFVDEGAEIVIGSHPHVVQDRETYRGKRIYYSLGNFIFDQYWDDSVRHGLLLSTIFDEEGLLMVREIPVQLEADGRTCVVSA